jgi:hypothetical protein
MYGIAYVIIPTEFASLQAVLDEALAPFRRGGPDEFPRDKLAFDDVTDEIRKLQREAIELKWEDGRVVLQSKDMLVGAWDFDGLTEFLRSTEAPTWSGRLADIDPDLDAFARRFTTWKQRDADAGGYGEWLNPMGRWDWWELGGRFDGLVSGEKRAGAGAESMISSGPNKGRDLIGGVMRALTGSTPEVEAEIAANVDLVSALLEAATRGEEHAYPTAVVLPVDVCQPAFRWFDALDWRPIPPETKALLSVPDDATFTKTAMAAWERFSDMAVAGIAYHF